MYLLRTMGYLFFSSIEDELDDQAGEEINTASF